MQETRDSGQHLRMTLSWRDRSFHKSGTFSLRALHVDQSVNRGNRRSRNHGSCKGGLAKVNWIPHEQQSPYYSPNDCFGWGLGDFPTMSSGEVFSLPASCSSES